ncbi:MAG: hypothetical protein Q9218_005128 [Villophora microphyllina]
MASWQVDIPSLSNLVVSAGAHGLKQLALSGVDIHTLGCMLMVSELTPACQDFRLNLNARREKQRGQRRWLYNLVELGAGSSFLVDHLLKTRAGENVLSLMASIVPLMSPDACIVSLSTLFDTAGVKPDHTPGVSQLHKLRNALVPFSRILGFQERVLQYHSMFERIVTPHCRANATLFELRCPYDAVPDTPNLARIIQFCHRITTSERSVVLLYKGFQGAGWVAAYASLILGYPVCAVGSAGVQFPINDLYGKAKVVLELLATESVCELHVEGRLGEVIHIDPLDRSSRGSWSVNCLELNYLRHHFPELVDPSDIRMLSEVVAGLTLKKLERPTQGLLFDRDWCSPYLADALPYIQERSLEILSLLGFDRIGPGTHGFSSAVHCGSTLSDANPASDPLNHLPRRGMDIPAGLANMKAQCMERLINVTADSEAVDPIRQILDKAVSLASMLAFTDWNTSLRTLAACHFDASSSSALEKWNTSELWIDCEQILQACTDTNNLFTRRLQMFHSEWLALGMDGVVVLRNLAVPQSLHDARGKIFSLLAGHISFEGQQREGVLAMPAQHVSGKSVIKDDRYIGPDNAIPNLQSRYFFGGSGETLFVRHEILQESRLFAIAEPVRISQNLIMSQVAQPCRHSYSRVMEYLGPLPAAPSGQVILSVTPGFTFYPGRKPGGIFGGIEKVQIYYQQTDNNELAQWLACQEQVGFAGFVHIWQRNSCLECIVQWIDKEKEIHSGTAFSIIADRVDT